MLNNGSAAPYVDVRVTLRYLVILCRSGGICLSGACGGTFTCHVARMLGFVHARACFVGCYSCPFLSRSVRPFLVRCLLPACPAPLVSSFLLLFLFPSWLFLFLVIAPCLLFVLLWTLMLSFFSHIEIFPVVPVPLSLSFSCFFFLFSDVFFSMVCHIFSSVC